LLDVLFGNADALAAVRRTVADPAAAPESRRAGLQMLITVKAANLTPLLNDLLAAPGPLRSPAIRALATLADPATPALILSHYPSLTDAEKADAVAALSSRPDFALALLDAVGKGTVPRHDLSAFTARQLLGLKDKRVSKRLEQVWGTVRSPAKDKADLLARYKALAPPGALEKADRIAGHAVFAKTCASCHTLFGEGGHIGPDLTGSQRANRDYLLSKLIDPNAAVNRDFEVNILTLKDGRILNGIVKEETDKTLALQTPTELIRVPKADVESREKTGQSMMPEGILATLSDREVRDLIAYVAGPGR
jgi:putative heme-binding domain-containing protein